jgi:diguanylate cyclase (GGDEF)-like protein
MAMEQREIWEFYENLNEVVYVVDVETYEVIYMNRKTRGYFDFESAEDYKGCKCYDLFHNVPKPCSFCNSRNLKKGEFAEWEFINPVYQSAYLLKDPLLEENGRQYRMEIAIDPNGSVTRDKGSQNNVYNESMVNEALRVSMAAVEPIRSINILLEYIGRMFKSERCYIFEEREGGRFANTFEWCTKGVEPEIDNLQNCSADIMEMWIGHFRQNKNIIIENLEDIKEKDPLMYDYLLPQKITSLVVSPLLYNNHIIGFYGVDNPPSESLKNISTLLFIMGHFIVTLLRRRDMYVRMENLSFYDQLTGFRNRHAMDEYMEELAPNKSIGVIYCDVTGLKRINDTKGHKEGDKLLVRACECIKEIFPREDGLFRVGGDEFLVICSGVEEDWFREKLVQLKRNMGKHEVMLALGDVWRPDARENLDKLFAEADERMYEDKRMHYAKFGGR